MIVGREGSSPKIPIIATLGLPNTFRRHALAALSWSILYNIFAVLLTSGFQHRAAIGLVWVRL